jgi:glycopeptide antibiotics resistance protein
MNMVDDNERALRHLKIGLLVTYLVFIVYGSWVPLQFEKRSWQDAMAAFQKIPFLELGVDSRADWVANLLLFIPMTFMASLLLPSQRHISQSVWMYLLLVIAAFCLSVGIEFTQLYFPQRTVSQNDIFAETTGGIIGIFCHLLGGSRVQKWLTGFWLNEQKTARSIRILHAYLVLLWVVNLFPLDLTINPVDILRKWREGRLVLIPFSGYGGNAAEVLYEVMTDAIVWIPVGALWALSAPCRAMPVVWKTVLAATVIEISQIFVYSRVTDVTDVGLAVIGAWIGWILVRDRNRYAKKLRDFSTRQWPLAWGVWMAFVMWIFWFPFNFDWTDVTFEAVRIAITRVPFTTYYFTSENHALNEVLRKISFFIPGGLLLGIGFQRTGLYAMRGLILFMLAMPAVVIELGQLALSGKVADLTDAFLEILGSALGYLLASVWKPDFSVRNTPRYPARLSPACIALTPQRHGGAIVLMQVIGMKLLLEMPGVPYNLRELMAPGLWGLGSLVALSVSLFAAVNGIFLLLNARNRVYFYMFPALLVLQGILTWGVLKNSVPLESLEDIVGSPVLNWSWNWEMIGRFSALYVSVVLQAVGAVLCVRAVSQYSAIADFLYWIVVCVVMAWPLYWLVIERAATDNLTELIAHQASFPAASLLALSLFFTFLTASSLSAAFAGARQSRRLIGIAVIATLGAGWACYLGTENTMIKYERVFSALQFLLSSDRENYVQGPMLIVRFSTGFVVIAMSLAAIQWTSWRIYFLKKSSLPA